MKQNRHRLLNWQRPILFGLAMIFIVGVRAQTSGNSYSTNANGAVIIEAEDYTTYT